MSNLNSLLPLGRGWAPLVLLPPAVLLLAPRDWPRWALMWSLAIAIYAGCKWLTWRRTRAGNVPWWRHVAYLLAWPGMDAKAFLTGTADADAQPTAREWLLAGAKLVAGCAVLAAAKTWVPARHEPLLGWTGLVGLVLVFHFGGFHLLSCFWRQLGIPARPLMRWPLAATSVSDFWGRRWNTAFRDLAFRFLFRPLAGRLGTTWGAAAGFLFSGLVHDVVISVPAGGGYGWPTLFFALQGAAMLAERSRLGKSLGLGRGWRGWAFAMLVVAGPAFGLFHPPFIRNVVVPFLNVFDAGGSAS
ncbi:MAG: MBOAT family protein [Pirellulaceae bacterium]